MITAPPSALEIWGVEKLKTMCQVLATPSHAGLSQSGEEVPRIAGSMKIGSAQEEILFLHP